MKLKLLLAAMTMLTLLGCNKSNDPKKTGDPTEDLVWLKKIKEDRAANCSCIPSIWQAKYEGSTIYEVGCAGPACLCAHSYYNEDGKSAPGSEEANRTVFLSKISDRKLLWSCGK